MLPTNSEFSDAILDAVASSDPITLQDLYEDVADLLGLDTAQRAERASSNGMLAYQDRISWVLTQLTRDGELHRPETAVYSLGPRPNRVRITDLTDRAAVNAAIDEFDRRGRDAFLEAYGFGRARDYFLVTESGRYDSKAIFGVAWRNQFGGALTPADFSGGVHGAAGQLANLGYDIEGQEESGEATWFDTFDAALELYPIPAENLPVVREFLADRDFTSFYVTPKRSYIGLVPPGGGREGLVRYGYIRYWDATGQSHKIELPINRLRRGGGASRRSKPVPAAPRMCPICGLQLPASGECGYC